jgi:biotin synthase
MRSSPSNGAPAPALNPAPAPLAWPLEAVEALYHQPLLALVERAHAVHALAHPEGEVQLCQLLSIKTGGCPEDCAYCPQSARYATGVEAERLLELEAVTAAAARAKAAGSTRFCMGAAWRQVKPGPEFERVLAMVRAVAAMDLEVCCTLGMLDAAQAEQLAAAGLTAYNHNLDTSPEFYGQIISTRAYDDRLRTLAHVRAAGITVCCGGILGMGESERDRLRLLQTLANLDPPPESVPINALVAVEGTPLAQRPPLEPFALVRAIATARILMPASKVRLSAGRLALSPEAQALCFYAGANSIFTGDKLLTTPNPGVNGDRALLAALGLKPEPPAASAPPAAAAPLEAAWAEALAAREARQQRRRLRPVEGEDFCSNDYLDLAQAPEIRAAVARAVADGIPLGATGSRLVRGNHPALVAAETDFAAWQGTEAALLFSSGYAAGVGLLTALLGRHDVVFSDACNHASLIDGIRASGARTVVFPHNDVARLEAALRRERAPQGARRGVVVESLYSMEGDFAPLDAIAEACAAAGAALIVDEAHATGLFGPEGAGRVAEAAALCPALERVLAARLHPCGKALGASGAMVAGSRRLIELLVNRARSFVFSTAPPPLLGVQLAAAVALIRREPQRRERVRGLARTLRAALRAQGEEPLGGEEAPIVPLVLGAEARALAAEQALAARGIDARAIRPPSVAPGASRLRLTVHADQTEADCRRVAEALAAARRATPAAVGLR